MYNSGRISTFTGIVLAWTFWFGLATCQEQWNDIDLSGVQAVQCLGKHSSPITQSDAVFKTREYDRINYASFETKPLNITLKNRGDALSVWAVYAEGQQPYIINIPMEKKDVFVFHELRFYWSSADTELCPDNVTRIMESHMVFLNSRFPTYENALLRDEAIAIFVTNYEISDGSSDIPRDAFTNKLQKISVVNSEAEIPGEVDLLTFMGPDEHEFFVYFGSLIHPKCQSDVLWIEFEGALGISRKDLDFFRSLLTFDGTPQSHDLCTKHSLVNRFVYKAKNIEDINDPTPTKSQGKTQQSAGPEALSVTPTLGLLMLLIGCIG